ncbi:DMT family transporter [Candidatus Roizmanbacteria bacterium]|nr:DMT family transporter [Candidatus Roizmanbacteria bacterium]
MIGIIFALLCAIFVAFSQLALRKSYQELPPSVAFLFDAIFGLLIWVPLAVSMGISENVSWREAIFFAVISAILSEAIVFYALSHGELAVTATVLATYPVYTVIFSRMLNNETLSLPITFFVGLAILGSIIASTPNKIKGEEFKLSKGIAWPFIAAVCIGLSDTISKGYINKSGDFSFLFSLGFVQIPVALGYLRIEKQSFTKSIEGVVKKLKDYKFALLGGLFNIIGTGFLWLSFSFAPASIASPITGANGALTVLFSKLILKEKIVARKYVGIILAFIGVIGITILRSS